VKEEVIKLKHAGAIKDIFYPKWLANTVVVKKKLVKWRVCVDFIDLNKACPKDPFSIPQIDQLVDATVGHPRSFWATWSPIMEFKLILIRLKRSMIYNLLEILRRCRS